MSIRISRIAVQWVLVWSLIWAPWANARVPHCGVDATQAQHATHHHDTEHHGFKASAAHDVSTFCHANCMCATLPQALLDIKLMISPAPAPMASVAFVDVARAGQDRPPKFLFA